MSRRGHQRYSNTVNDENGAASLSTPLTRCAAPLAAIHDAPVKILDCGYAEAPCSPAIHPENLQFYLIVPERAIS